jgi:pimeloyl-ACP methyl ester carboxylesterase
VILDTPYGAAIEYLSSGKGEPVTVFAHGLGSSIEETRPLGSAVPGTRVFFHFRGHGGSVAPAGHTPWGYPDLAADLRAVADATGATRAVGTSLGAAALCRLLVAQPDRFARLVFFLPAVLDEPRTAVARQRLVAVLAGDRTADVPSALRDTPAARAYLAARPPLAPELAALADAVAVPDLTALAAVTAPALVIGCRGDSRHPDSVAARLAAALPRATLHIYDEPAPVWTARADLRARIAPFLAE